MKRDSNQDKGVQDILSSIIQAKEKEEPKPIQEKEQQHPSEEQQKERIPLLSLYKEKIVKCEEQIEELSRELRIAQKEKQALLLKSDSTKESSSRKERDQVRPGKGYSTPKNKKLHFIYSSIILLLLLAFGAFMYFNKGEHAEKTMSADETFLQAQRLFDLGGTQNFESAASLFRNAAEEESADAQFMMGYCYEYGYGLTKDDSKAASWYRKAAENGHARAQCALGIKYEEGIGITKDETKAVQWYKKAADQGYTRAQCNLGKCYMDGTGVEENEAKAVQWFRKAAVQGDVIAQFNLGVCYEWGYGVTEDETEAEYWYRQAAEQGYQDAIEAIDGLTNASAQTVTDSLAISCEH